MVATQRVRAGGNRILDGLPTNEQRRVAAGAEQVRLIPGEVICLAGHGIEHVFFPREGVISLLAPSGNGSDVGVGIVGTAGMFGLAVAAGDSVSRLLAVSQGHGSADRIDAAGFVDLMRRSAGLRAAMLVYGHEMAAQMAQNTACALLHPARQRLARWMLDVTHGSPGGSMSSTQTATAMALGLQRPAVSRAAGFLQQLGLIHYLRGEVSILDRAGLAAIACACSLPMRGVGAAG